MAKNFQKKVLKIHKKCLVSAFVKEFMFTRPFVPLYNEESTIHISLKCTSVESGHLKVNKNRLSG